MDESSHRTPPDASADAGGSSDRVPEHVHLVRALASLALDYLRWTQLVPMLFSWTFLLLMVAALLLTNFQDASFALLERGIGVYERVVGPLDLGPPGATDDGATSATGAAPGAAGGAEDRDEAAPAMTFTDEDILPVVLRAWALLALVGWLFGVLRSMLFGPREPRRLWPKLRIALYVAIGCSGLMWIAYALGTSTFNGGIAGWALLFTGIPLGVWLVSAWSLTFGHLVGRLQRHLHA
ncbi:hypothetical protein [Halomonas denitrificans]|nr:hypothetical protein [Halomonas denitrificans]